MCLANFVADFVFRLLIQEEQLELLSATGKNGHTMLVNCQEACPGEVDK